MAPRALTVSVVSHRQNALASLLLRDLGRLCGDAISLVVTENVPDPAPLELEGLPCPVARIANRQVKGFGANHNAAFARCTSEFFCVANPDLRLEADPFAQLMRTLSETGAAAVGPLVRSPAGAIEDSARRFPTLAGLLRKLFAGGSGPDYPADGAAVEVDWVAGMCIVLRSADFRAVGGFDESYFLYYEDVDLCRRLARAGRKVFYEPRAAVLHDARRGSRSNPLLMRHHLRSAARFLFQR